MVHKETKSASKQIQSELQKGDFMAGGPNGLYHRYRHIKKTGICEKLNSFWDCVKNIWAFKEKNTLKESLWSNIEEVHRSFEAGSLLLALGVLNMCMA